MMYRAGEPEEEEQEERKEKKEERKEGRKTGEERAIGEDRGKKGGGGDKDGRFKTLEDETANDFHGRIITTPFVFCSGDKSLVDNVSMKEVSFPSFSFSSLRGNISFLNSSAFLARRLMVRRL